MQPKYTYLLTFIAGLLAPLGFAPFHLPGLTLMSLGLLFAILINHSKKQSFLLGFIYGLGYFSLGVSWIIISIHDYGQMNYFLSALITLLFIAYLALYPALTAYCFKFLQPQQEKPLILILLFSTLWCISEYMRANLFGGFPWLFVGISQIGTPLKSLTPILGIYGLSLFCALAACSLAQAILSNGIKKYYYLIAFSLIFLLPALVKNIEWTQVKKEPVSIAAVQSNLSMRDKWDEELFWNLLGYYEKAIDKLLGKQLIILPESAIPLPANYLEDYLLKLHTKALAAKSTLMLGILQATNASETHYYNSIISLGNGQGEHLKYQLVPFGEYIPKLFSTINKWFNLPEPNIIPGKLTQDLIKIANIPIASLICYEISYPQLLRAQMPLAQWIVSISDNGWFGRSLASYQQLQMAQVLSLLTGRFQIVVNNDGLSSIINAKGEITHGLPPFSSGILESHIHPAEGSTPWIFWYDYPVLIFCALFLILMAFFKLPRFSNQTTIDDKDKRGYSSASPSLN